MTVAFDGGGVGSLRRRRRRHLSLLRAAFRRDRVGDRVSAFCQRNHDTRLLHLRHCYRRVALNFASFCLSVCLSLSFYFPLSLSLSLSLFLSVCLSLCLCH